MSIEFATIASGSSGNCIYVGTENTKILIDAGLSGKKIETGLASLGIDPQDIDGIFVTHEHNDHVDGIGVLSRRYDMPVYATEGTWDNMPSKVGEIRHSNMHAVYAGEYCGINDIVLKPFNIPHDAAQPVGYRIEAFGKTLTVATDIGYISDEVFENIKNVDLLLLESNHDVDMLKNGPYPYQLKQRVLSDFGHLSNNTAGDVLAKSISEKLKYIILGHLSGENNTPRLAFDTVKKYLETGGVAVSKDVELFVAAKYGVQRRIELA